MKRLVYRVTGWVIAVVTLALTLSCRRRILEDSRSTLRDRGIPYVLAGLHAHQAAMVFFNDEKKLAAMVSRSNDGDLLAPSLRARHVVPIRGSSSRDGRDKGGARALVQMLRFVQNGGVGLITVDGPRGPRNTVNPGIVVLAKRAGAWIVPVALVPHRRWILTRSWDRMQIPKPFARLDAAFGLPIDPDGEDDAAEQILRDALWRLERRYDPDEAVIARKLQNRRRLPPRRE